MPPSPDKPKLGRSAPDVKPLPPESSHTAPEANAAPPDPSKPEESGDDQAGRSVQQTEVEGTTPVTEQQPRPSAEPAAPTAVVQIVSVPPCTDVDIGTMRIGKAPLVTNLAPGAYTISFSWPDRIAMRRRSFPFNVSAGTTQVIGRQDSISVSVVDHQTEVTIGVRQGCR
jgi:hypothetical protein